MSHTTSSVYGLDSDMHGDLCRKIAGVFGQARDPRRYTPKGTRRGTPGEVTLLGDDGIAGLTVWLCTRIRCLGAVTQTNDRGQQRSMVFRCLLRLRDEGVLYRRGATWRMDARFIESKKRESEQLRQHVKGAAKRRPYVNRPRATVPAT